VDAIVDVLGGLFEATAKVVSISLKAVGLFALVAVSVAAGALVGRDYWNWFVVPLGLPHIGLAQALGLVMFVAFLRTDYSRKAPSEKRDEDIIATSLGFFLNLSLTWGLGWLIVTLVGPF
jgi:hypothetical protein